MKPRILVVPHESYNCSSTGFSEVDLTADSKYQLYCKKLLQSLPSRLILYSLSLITVSRNRKLVHIEPIFKGGQSSEPSISRPIALLSTPSRVMKSLKCDGLHDYLLSINFSSIQQHGLGQGYSYVTNQLNAVDRWTSIDDHKEKADAFNRIIYKCFTNN